MRALAKLEQVLSSRLRYRVRSLSAATVPLPAGDGPGVDPGLLTTLAAAITGRERVRFGYQAGDGAASTRLADPHRLVAAGRRWYLLACDNDRQDWRIFRTDQIRDLQPTGTRTPLRDPAGRCRRLRRRQALLPRPHLPGLDPRIPRVISGDDPQCLGARPHRSLADRLRPSRCAPGWAGQSGPRTPLGDDFHGLLSALSAGRAT